MTSYSQNFEDVILDRVFRDVETGFYVDVGANDPVQYSVTKYFYLYGWRGINIEPGRIFEKLLQDRPGDVNLNLAIANRRGTSAFHEFPALHGWSSLSGHLPEGSEHLERVVREVPTMPLRDVFAEHGVRDITYMSIDVEGAERDVLVSNDWKRWRPRVVLLEATLPNSPVPCHELWEDVILAADYLFAYFDGLNRFYVRAEDRALMERFQPPNVFDNFQLHDAALLREETASLKLAIAGLKEEIAEQQKQKEQLRSDVNRIAQERALLNARLLGSDNPEDRALAERLSAASAGDAAALREEIETLRFCIENLKEENAEQQKQKDFLTNDRDRLAQEQRALNERLVAIEQGVGGRSLSMGLWLARTLHAIGKLFPQKADAESQGAEDARKKRAA